MFWKAKKPKTFEGVIYVPNERFNDITPVEAGKLAMVAARLPMSTYGIIPPEGLYLVLDQMDLLDEAMKSYFDEKRVTVECW